MPSNQSGKQYSLKLSTQADIAFACGVSNARIWQLDKEGFLPQPFAVVGYRGDRSNQIQKLYSEKQLKDIVAAFRKRKESVHANGIPKDNPNKKVKQKPGPKPKVEKPKVEKPKPVTTNSIARDTFETLGTTCPDCGDWVFNLSVHQDFAHKNKLGKVGAKS